jgi:pimeloyl-ACP methyl ester carboxylesterase
MRPSTVVTVAAAGVAAAYAAVQAANAVIRRQEDVDPDALTRPGAMFFIRGLGIHYAEQGHGPPVVLLHGFGASMFSFRHQVGPLAEHFRVLALDLPGFGYSDRPADADLSLTAQAERVREFLDRMGVERATLIGHSMGGAIAMRLAAAHPDRVERLVLAAGAPPDTPVRLPLYPLLRPLSPIPLAFLAGNERYGRRTIRRIVYDPATLTDDVLRAYTRPLRLRGTAACLIKMLGDVRRDPPLDPATVSARTLLLYGEADTVVPLRVAHRLHAVMPDARLEVVPRAGHLLLEEQPRACTDAILRFLSAPVPAGGPVTP